MKRAIKAVGRGLAALETIFLEVCLALMCILILVATLARILEIPFITWSEELARNLMIWLGLLGAGAVARDGNHFSVNFLFAGMKNKLVQRAFFLIIQLGMLGFCAFATYYGLIVCIKQHNMGQLSPALQIPIWILYLSIPLCGISMGIQSTLYYIPLITGKKIYSSDMSAGKLKAEEGDEQT
jgi:C4-dicarboxylate transporter DctQ subunit